MRKKIQPARSAQSIRGFTLTELLVVIVIIVVLAALSMMGISRFRNSAFKSISIGNLKALQIANASYASDHAGVFVGTFARDENGKVNGIWVSSSEFLDDYLGAAEVPTSGSMEDRVPVSALDPVAYRAGKSGYKALKASYGSVSKEGYTKSGPNSTSAYRMSELTAPHRTAAFVTAINWLVEYSNRFYWKGEEGKVNAPAMAYRYGDKVLVAYYDGHVGELSKADIEKIDEQGGKNNVFWTGTAN